MERPFYKLIILIIDSDDPVYTVHRATWRAYMNSDPEVLSLFLRYSPTHEGPNLDFSANTLTFKGTDSLIPGILYKTLDAFDYCLQHFTFDHILRTNISSFFVFPLLKERVLSTLPRIGCYAGFRINNHYNTDFISGTGIYISADVAQTLIQNRELYRTHLPDDVAIGYFLTRTGTVSITSTQPFFSFTSDTDTDHDTEKIANAISCNAVHFRIKNQHNRLHFDSHYLRLLLRTYYSIEL